MSLTLNVSKEAKLFYQSEQKIREGLEGGVIQPSSTIHMKKYSPAGPTNSRSVDNHLFGSSDAQSSDECLEELEQNKDWMSQSENNVSSTKRRRLLSQRKDSRIIPTPSNISHHSSKYSQPIRLKSDKHAQYLKRQRQENREYIDKRRQDQKEGSQQREIKHKHILQKESPPLDEIPSRDLHGGENDSDEMREDLDHISYDISPAQDPTTWPDDDLLEIDGAESRNISENNPFARQRILKSKYKSMYSS